jgi:ribosome-associated protein
VAVNNVNSGDMVKTKERMTEISTENKVVKQTEVTDKELTQYIVDAIQDKKGRGISIVDLSEMEMAPTREFIICEGRTPQQVAAIADNVRESLLENHRIKPYNYDGYRKARWIVIDYGSVMVHVFVPDDRELYNLEDLWNDAKITEIPDLD